MHTSCVLFLSQTACHMGWGPLSNLPSLLPRWQRSLQPSLQLESLVVAPVEHVQLFEVKCLRQKKWHAEPVSH